MREILCPYVVVLLVALFPALLGYARRLVARGMILIWLWLGLLPVIGWVVAVGLALAADRPEGRT